MLLDFSFWNLVSHIFMPCFTGFVSFDLACILRCTHLKCLSFFWHRFCGRFVFLRNGNAMETEFKVMAYQLKKTKDEVWFKSMVVDDSQVDEFGELALATEDTTMQRRGQHGKTGFFHPGSEKPKKLSHTGVFHPSIVGGVAYIAPESEVSSSQIIESSELLVSEDPMKVIDEVLVSIMKTESHEMVFDNELLLSDTQPEVGFAREPALGHSGEDLSVRPKPRWMAPPSVESVNRSSQTQLLRSTRRPVVIPDAHGGRPTEQLRAWTQRSLTAVPMDAPAAPRRVEPERFEPVEVQAISVVEAERGCLPARDSSDEWRDFSSPSSLSIYQKVSITLLGLILVVELARLWTGS